MPVQVSPHPQRPARSPAPAPPAFTPARSLLLQRKCACGGTAGSGGECEECKKKKMLQRRATNTHSVSGVPPIVHDVLSSSGRPLDAGTRGFMEPRFGHDFSQVRVHDDARAAESARAVNADAYTVGQDIVFDSDRYQPESQSGRELLAHELAHTIQQRGLQRSTGGVGMPSNVEDQVLEREAEAAASRVLLPHPPSRAAEVTSISRAERPVLSRVAKKKAAAVNVTTASAYMNTSHNVTVDDEYVAGGKKVQAFTVDKLTLPATKGPKALTQYKALAAESALQATLDVSGTATKAALWQERAVTDDLRERWLQRMGWPGGKDADDLWRKAGGDSEFPKVGGSTCQMDHVVELQIGGNNTNENIQPLDAAQNRDSGGAIKQEVFMLGQNILAEPTLSDGTADQIKLRFKTVALSGTPEKMPAKGTSVASPATCLSVEFCAANVKVPKGKGPAATGEPYQLRAGGAETTVQVPSGFKQAPKTQKAEIHSDPVNQAAAELIPGFLLNTLHHAPAADTVKGQIDDRPKTRLPITIDDKRGDPVTFDVAKASGKLTFSSSKTAKGLKFSYPYLSPGEITKLSYDEAKGMEFEGWIKTKIPFLGRLDVAYGDGKFRLIKDLNKGLKSPIPGTRITKAELGLDLWPELKPSGTLAFAAGPVGKELFDAELTVFKDSSGLAAKGTLNAHIPGADEASGQLLYSAGMWTGGATIRSDQLKNKFKYVKSGEVTVTFENGKLTPSGSVTLDLPYSEGVTAKLYQEKGRWVFEGNATIDPPRLSKIGIHVKYDGRNFEGVVSPGPTFKLLGFSGGVEKLTYRNGKFSGTGSLEFTKGKAKGKLTINLLETGKFTGRGDITYQVSENLVASGAAELDKDEKLHISGTLKYLKPIDLPRTSFGGDKTLFKAGMSIPIPGLSLGPAVGLKARIEGELTAGFKIGPAQIRNVEISAAFNPLEDNPNLEVAGGAEFYMPASAYIGGSISAGIMLDLFIGDVTGGLTVRVRADLDGHFKATVKATYTPKRYSMGADFELMLALILIFGIDAFLRARAGWGPFSVSTSKTWVLGEKKIDSGLKFGLRFPLKYASDEPFKAPSWDSIEFIKPTIDFGHLLDRVISSTTPQEKKG